MIGREGRSSDGTVPEDSPQDRGWLDRRARELWTFLQAVALLLAVACLAPLTAVALLVAVPANSLWYVGIVARNLGRQAVGKAVVQRSLEGRILVAKQDVLRIGLELYEMDLREEAASRDVSEEVSSALTLEKIRDFERLIGFDDGSSGRRFEFWIPGQRWLHEGWRRMRARWERLRRQPASVASAKGDPLPDGGSGDERADDARAERTRSNGESRTTDGPTPAVGENRSEASELVEMPLRRDTQWAIITMELLNEAERYLKRNVETAYRTYLRVERLLIAGEHRVHVRRGQRREECLDGSEASTTSEPWYTWLSRRVSIGEREEETDSPGDFDDPVQTGARIALHRAEDYDPGAMSVVRELLCRAGESESTVDVDDGDTNVASEPPNGSAGDAAAAVENPWPAGETVDPKPSLSMAELDRALEELNRHRLKQHRRLENLRVTILVFVGVPALLLGVLLFYFPSFMEIHLQTVTGTLVVDEVGLPTLGRGFRPHSEQLFFALILGFGALGAAISGTRTVEHGPESLRTLEEVLGYWLALVRMVIGAISAFIVTVFLFSGLVNEVFLSLPLAFGLSIAAGFSERVALHAIASFETRAMSVSGSETAGRREEEVG